MLKTEISPKKEKVKKTLLNFFKRKSYLSWRTGKLTSLHKKERVIERFLVFIFILFFSILIVPPSLPLRKGSHEIGDVAPKNIKSPTKLLIEDVLSTEKRRNEEEKRVPPVYELNERELAKIQEKIRTSFFLIREYVEQVRMLEDKMKGEDSSKNPEVPSINNLKEEMDFLRALGTQKEKEFIGGLGVNLGKDQYKILEENAFPKEIEEILLRLVNKVMKKGIIGERTEGVTWINLRNIYKNQEKIVQHEGFLDLIRAKEVIKKEGEEILKSKPFALKEVVIKIASHMIRPNIVSNKAETEKRKAMARQRVSPVLLKIKKGEMIVREGERITPEQYMKLKVLEKAKGNKRYYITLLSMTLLLSLIFSITYNFSKTNIKRFRLRGKDTLLFGISLIFSLLIVKLIIFNSQILSSGFPYILASSYLYAIPLAAWPMLICIVLNPETALVFAILNSLLTALILKGSLFMFLYSFLGSLVAIYKVTHCTRRNTLIKAGFLVGLLNIFIILLWNAIGKEELGGYLLYDMVFGFMGGILSAIVVTGVTPIVEWVFGYITDIELLELSSLDQPLLKRLMVEAPGTYHHSIVVGSMAEAAAEAIGANPLLAKVGSYYHDIGKIKKPLYFIENQKDWINKHDKLSPHMSSLILVSHVKEGEELARQHGLGDKIIDIIKQHHGTSTITYFYQKAKSHEDPHIQTVAEEDFSYPGPKPQTKEAGLVLLADAVEAASRTLNNPNPGKIQGLVQKIINNFFIEGQLDECELTLKDLHKIAKSFNQVLTGIFHHRIDYSEASEKTGGDGKKVEDNGSTTSSETRDKVEVPRKNGGHDIRRLGLS